MMCHLAHKGTVLRYRTDNIYIIVSSLSETSFTLSQQAKQAVVSLLDSENIFIKLCILCKTHFQP